MEKVGSYLCCKSTDDKLGAGVFTSYDRSAQYQYLTESKIEMVISKTLANIVQKFFSKNCRALLPTERRRENGDMTIVAGCRQVTL